MGNESEKSKKKSLEECDIHKKHQVKRKVTRKKRKVSKKLRSWENEKPDVCPICIESLDNVGNPLECGHWVHRKCIVKWGKEQCPVCRKKLNLSAKSKRLIEQVSLRHKREQEDEDYRELINEERELDGMIENIGGNGIFLVNLQENNEILGTLSHLIRYISGIDIDDLFSAENSARVGRLARLAILASSSSSSDPLPSDQTLQSLSDFPDLNE